jgi:hypothetical protein
MSSSQTEKMRSILNEYYDKKQEWIDTEIINRMFGIFMWGFMCGIVFSYTNTLALAVGTFLGFGISRKNIPLFNLSMIYLFGILEKGKNYVLLFTEKPASTK